MKIKLFSLIILSLTLAMAFPPPASSQDYYSGKTEIACNGEVYKISCASEGLCLSNKKNHIIDELRYKVGSNPVRYYSYATGMGTPADIDYDKYDEIVRKVFTGVTGNPYNAIPIEKFYELEKLLKAEMVCSLSDELKKEKQSHGYTTTDLF